MAFSKARRLSDFIAADGTVPATKFATGTITSAMIADTSITPTDLHTTLDLTGKTVTVATAAGSTNTTAAASAAFVQQELTSGLAPKATIASPTFTGTPSGPTASGSTTTTQLATTAFVQQELTTLIGGAPSTLNDLNELAAAINDDANYNSTLTTALATKLPLAGGTLTGNVGIGTTPASGVRLDMRSNAAVTIGDFRNASATGFGLYVAAGDTASQYAFRAADYQNNALFSVMGDGKVGIGRTDPQQLLEVHKAAGGDQTVAKFSAHNYGDTGKTFIEIGTEHGDGSSRIGSFNDTGNKSVLVFDTHDAGSGSFTERMRISSSGNISVGTTTSAKFEINHGAQTGALGLSTATAFKLSQATGAPAVGNIVQMSMGYGNNYSNIAIAAIRTSAAAYGTDDLVFATKSGTTDSAPTERMRINSSGKVIIGSGGTTTYNANLQVAGDITTTVDGNAYQLYYTESRDFITNAGATATIKMIDNDASSGKINFDAWDNSTIMTVMNNGNVGIGIVPAGYATSGYALRLDGGSQTYISWNNDTHTTQVLGGFHIGNDSAAARIIQREDQPIIFSTDDTNRMQITADGVVSAPITSIHGGFLHAANTPNPAASYLGSNGADFGTTAIYRTPTITSSATVAATSQFLTIYTSGHWGEYPVFKFKVYGTYYAAGYREYIGYMTGTSAGLNAVETHGTATSVGTGGNNTITMGSAVSSGLAAHGGQPRYRRDFTLTSHGNYGRCHVVVEIMYGGNRYYGSSTSTSTLDALGSSGGSYHFKTMSTAQGQGTFST